MARGSVAEARFAQPIIGHKVTNTGADVAFSGGGRQYFRDLGLDVKTPADLSRALSEGRVSPSQLPVDFVDLDGTRLIMNTRTSIALRDAGIPRSDWFGRNRTGQIAIPATEFEPAITFDQLARRQLEFNSQYAIPGQIGWPELLVPRAPK